MPLQTLDRASEPLLPSQPRPQRPRARPACLRFRPLLLWPLLSLSVSAVTNTVPVLAVPPLLLQMLLHLPQGVQALLDLFIWTWARWRCPSSWGELVPRRLGLGFCCTLAEVCEDTQSFLLPLLRGQKIGADVE